LPNLFTFFSPRLDDIGNSVRGVQFCKLIAKRFSFHAFAPLTEDNISNEQEEEYLAKATKQKEHQSTEGKHSGVVVTETTTTTSSSPSEILKSPGSPRSESRRLSRRNSWIEPKQAQEDQRWDPRRHDERNDGHKTEEENALEMLWAAYV